MSFQNFAAVDIKIRSKSDVAANDLFQVVSTCRTMDIAATQSDLLFFSSFNGIAAKSIILRNGHYLNIVNTK